MPALIRATTVLGLTHRGKTAIGSDGQVTVGQTVMHAQAEFEARYSRRKTTDQSAPAEGEKFDSAQAVEAAAGDDPSTPESSPV